MPTIKNIESGDIITVSAMPIWRNGIWECGDKRFTDVDQTIYSSVSASPLPTISPVMFYMTFTAMEMIAIKASEDPLVKEFFARYMIAYEKNEPIDPNLVSVQEGLAYLAAPASPGPGAGILASTDRIAQISAGIPQ